MYLKIKNNLKRFLPAEIISLFFAFSFATSTYAFTENKIIAAYSGTIGDIIGYYGYLFLKDLAHYKKFSKVLTKLSLEFGPAELLDSFILRPFCLYFFPRMTFNYAHGIIIGKFCADILFYLNVFFASKLFKKHFNF